MPEPGRVVIRPFQVSPDPKAQATNGGSSRARRIVQAVLAMDMRTCQTELALVRRDFGQRHWQTLQIFLQRFEQVREQLDLDPDIRIERKELIGAYFCHEYSFTSAALMNPSVVPHPDQSGLVDGSLRVVISLRAVGEGHISSIAFREGILNHQGGFDLMPRPSFSIAVQLDDGPPEPDGAIHVRRFEDASLSGTVIFPFTDQQRNGLEDLRLTKLEAADGEPCYYGTYTAYSGKDIRSEFLVTRDFREFTLQPIQGVAARNKGMALFPRRINGRYACIGRQDGENLFYLTSDDLLHWDEGELILAPQYPWELVQMGNCGAPIEIDEGWLLLTHGVGAVRKYSIGACLLDKDDPRKVIGRSVVPLLSPSDEDREGYVPNVVYTCGALVHGRRLFMPFAVADSSISFGFVNLDALLSELF